MNCVRGGEIFDIGENVPPLSDLRFPDEVDKPWRENPRNRRREWIEDDEAAEVDEIGIIDIKKRKTYLDLE
ncbi:hypothetical protein QVD17_18773 [Tagetes erecta]|uniref:Uncharacterized protein n=1 Tax=Tagetes erecta TaxID=13708 RepID=A0AAD8KIB7_TARER|nr:hypothetical protein QVD17_18773 [Tagetes erecta]